ncbi:MAG: hypothetical protein WAV32_05835 [Halobacteriota archaeon]
MNMNNTQEKQVLVRFNSSILNKKWRDIGWIVVFLFFGIIANYFILNRRNTLSGGIE